MLTSPTYGLEDVWRSQFVFAIGSLFGLSPIGLIKLAAFFGTLKLAVAGICAVHILDRLRALVGGKADSEILEGGLILVVLISIAVGRPGGVVAERRTGARSTPSSCCSPRSPPRSAWSSATTAVPARTPSPPW